MFFTPLLQGAAALLQAPPAAAAGVQTLKVPYTRQPQGPVEIDWSNPITRGLKTALSPLYDHAKQRRPIYYGTVEYATRASGRSLNGNNSSMAYTSVSGVADAVTIMYVGSFTRTVNNNIFAGLGVSAGNELICFQFYNIQNNRVVIRQTNGGGLTYRDFGANATTLSAEKVSLVGVITGTSSIDVYWNGLLDNGTLTTGSTGNNSGFNTAALGGVQRATASYADFGTDGALMCYWNRALTAAEIAKISANPWQLFKPTRRLIGFTVSSATISRPNSDIVVSGWIGVPDNTNLYANIDEVTPSTADYIQSPDLSGTPGPAIFGLTQSLAAGTYAVRISASQSGTSGQVRAVLRDSGGIIVGTSAWQALTATPTQYALTVTTTGTATQGGVEVQP